MEGIEGRREGTYLALGFFNLNILDIGGQFNPLLVGAVLCIVGFSAASLASCPRDANDTSPPVVRMKLVSRHCQMSPNTGIGARTYTLSLCVYFPMHLESE